MEVGVGINRNTYSCSEYPSFSFSSELRPQLFIGFYDIKVDWLRIGMEFNFSYYDFDIEANYDGQVGKYTTIAQIDKSLASLALFPINFSLLQKIKFNLGFEMSYLLHEKYTGTQSGYIVYDSGLEFFTDNLEEKLSSFNSKSYFGLKAKIAYDIYINEKVNISPQYSYYLGLSDEFMHFPEYVKSRKHFFGVGIQRKF